jgi:hypothetical protein
LILAQLVNKSKVCSLFCFIEVFTSSTVGENIIATTKIRNDYGVIQSLDFYLLLIVKLSLLIIFGFFLLSVLCFFFDSSVSKVIALPTIAIAIVVSLSRSAGR